MAPKGYRTNGTDYSDAKGTLFTDTKEHLCFIQQCKECDSAGREGQRLNVCMTCVDNMELRRIGTLGRNHKKYISLFMHDGL